MCDIKRDYEVQCDNKRDYEVQFLYKSFKTYYQTRSMANFVKCINFVADRLKIVHIENLSAIKHLHPWQILQLT